MITKEEVIPLFLEACPSFAPRWQEHCAECGEEQLLYVALGKLVHYLVDLLQQGDTQEFPAVFAACERLHLEGDRDVREAATIGLLEAIQNLPPIPGEIQRPSSVPGAGVIEMVGGTQGSGTQMGVAA